MAATRVLIADDNMALARTVGEILSDQGYDVAIVSTGAQALVAWRERPADLVVVDVDLPDIRGLTVARRLAQRHGGCALLVMSAGDARDLMPLCEELGARFLAKPFGPSHLLAEVRAILKQRAEKARARRPTRRLLASREPKALLQHRRRR